MPCASRVPCGSLAKTLANSLSIQIIANALPSISGNRSRTSSRESNVTVSSTSLMVVGVDGLRTAGGFFLPAGTSAFFCFGLIRPKPLSTDRKSPGGLIVRNDYIVPFFLEFAITKQVLHKTTAAIFSRCSRKIDTLIFFGTKIEYPAFES